MHDTRQSGGTFLQEGCRVMDSKKTPMMMEFSSVGHCFPLAVMFKAGDDLRQDHVMMKLFEMCSQAWLQVTSNVTTAFLH